MDSIGLLAIRCKKSKPADLKTPMHQSISQNYSSRQAENTAKDLAAMQEARGIVCGVLSSQVSLEANLRKYYELLVKFENAFPMADIDARVADQLCWSDAFQPKKAMKYGSLRHEKAAIIFNLAAIATQQALEYDTATSSNLKLAARNLQAAAGMFGLLKRMGSLNADHFIDIADSSHKSNTLGSWLARSQFCLSTPSSSSQHRRNKAFPVDTSPLCAAMLETLSLAQAQECAFARALLDGSSPGVLARVAQQTAAFYQDLKLKLRCPPLDKHLDKFWLSHASVKVLLHEAEAQFQAARQLRLVQEVASEIARLKEAQKLLSKVNGIHIPTSAELQSAVSNLKSKIKTNLSRAERENNIIYLKPVPRIADLPAIVPASLVKSKQPTFGGYTAVTSKHSTRGRTDSRKVPASTQSNIARGARLRSGTFLSHKTPSKPRSSCSSRFCAIPTEASPSYRGLGSVGQRSTESSLHSASRSRNLDRKMRSEELLQPLLVPSPCGNSNCINANQRDLSAMEETRLENRYSTQIFRGKGWSELERRLEEVLVKTWAFACHKKVPKAAVLSALQDLMALAGGLLSVVRSKCGLSCKQDVLAVLIALCLLAAAIVLAGRVTLCGWS